MQKAIDLSLHHGGQWSNRQKGWSWAGGKTGVGLEELGGQISHLMRQHMLLQVPLGGKAPVACCANERSLFGMATVMDVQGTLAGKCLATDVTCCIL